jgi:alpha-L-fucosidase
MIRNLILCALASTALAHAGEPPSTKQLQEDFLKWKFGMFIHFNLATYHEREWANGYEDPLTFAPEKLDCTQWADVCKAAGMNYAVLTVKHTEGYGLWDSKHTSHDITAFANYKNGKGDIVREYVDAFRKSGLKVGLYYCMPGNYSKDTLPEGKPDLHGLPPEAKGDFVGFIKKQITELLTNYGPIDLLWFDQYKNPYTGKNWPEIKAHVKSIQPNCIVIANNSLNDQETDIHSYEYPWLVAKKSKKTLPSGGNMSAAEVCDIMGPAWFWKSTENSSNLKKADEIVKMVKFCNDRRANYLLNVAPDKTGLIPDYTVERLRQVGQLLATENRRPTNAPKTGEGK